MPEEKKEEAGTPWLSAIAIPMVLLVLPAVGGYVGRLVDAKMGSGSKGLWIGLLVGLVLAVFWITKLLRKLSGDESKGGNS